MLIIICAGIGIGHTSVVLNRTPGLDLEKCSRDNCQNVQRQRRLAFCNSGSAGGVTVSYRPGCCHRAISLQRATGHVRSIRRFESNRNIIDLDLNRSGEHARLERDCTSSRPAPSQSIKSAWNRKLEFNGASPTGPVSTQAFSPQLVWLVVYVCLQKLFWLRQKEKNV